jgi:hypothetical protein
MAQDKFWKGEEQRQPYCDRNSAPTKPPVRKPNRSGEDIAICRGLKNNNLKAQNKAIIKVGINILSFVLLESSKNALLI